MDDAELAELAAAGRVLLVTSTFGDGGPPDNGADFWARLSAPDAPSLAGVQYTVLGIGDRSYDDFCGHAKSLDARLADLGATKILDRTECEAHDEPQMAQWADSVIELIAGSEPRTPTTATPAPSPRDAEPEPFTRARPIEAPLCRNTRLTSADSTKDVRQLGFDISAHDVTYAAGDSLGVYVTNSDFVIENWLAATGLTGNEVIVVDGVELSMRDAIRAHFDVCRVTPNLVRFVAEHSPRNSTLKKLCVDRDKLDTWLSRRNGLDLVGEFAVHADPQEWQHVLVRLTPRQYSISSSPLVSPHEVQLTVSVVRYLSADGGPRAGVASSHLAELPDGATVPVFLQRSPHFRPPQESSTPMIMVGPGTGIAPFRGFLQERRALGHTGRNWLFFGDQHRAQNFYYRDDLLDMVDDGHLNRLDLAFSRDQAERVYVQHKMLDYGADVWDWLQDGAHFYVCGDATRMAKDVDVALTEIIRAHGGMSEDAARDYKRRLVADKRYVRDVY